MSTLLWTNEQFKRLVQCVDYETELLLLELRFKITCKKLHSFYFNHCSVNFTFHSVKGRVGDFRDIKLALKP